jgi:hypothetical protein
MMTKRIWRRYHERICNLFHNTRSSSGSIRSVVQILLFPTRNYELTDHFRLQLLVLLRLVCPIDQSNDHHPLASFQIAAHAK